MELLLAVLVDEMDISVSSAMIVGSANNNNKQMVVARTAVTDRRRWLGRRWSTARRAHGARRAGRGGRGASRLVRGGGEDERVEVARGCLSVRARWRAKESSESTGASSISLDNEPV